MSDELYAAVEDFRNHAEFTEREKVAAAFAEQFAIDHTAIDDAMWERLHAVFSDVEILDLTTLVGFCVGMGRAYQVLDIARDFDVLWSREPDT
ncbi:carboxymuconolactone decarboxylase family protein [Ilumatobacter nonamiensis]|uniref:carboxymuconolactone decarboxylase family protein n=1 Tax=Ilumatobacter nonamiensis TaxID=467093 RepID=UPI0003469A47|nr:hypothetical protein [Ilumatobacter nonamiensis]